MDIQLVGTKVWLDQQKDNAAATYQRARIEYWDSTARRMDTWSGWGGHYHRRLAQIYRTFIPPEQRVLEIGCGCGDLLAAVRPSLGVGVDFSGEMIRRATQRYPELHFVQVDAHVLSLEEKFDYIILSDLLNDLWDVQRVFEQVKQLTTSGSRIIINSYSRLWELPLGLAQRLGLAKPVLGQNWLTVPDITNLLDLADFECIRHWGEVLFPLPMPILDQLADRYLVKVWPFSTLALSNFIVARPRAPWFSERSLPLVSVVVPARNEVGNIEQIFERTPEMGRGTELVFVEGHSKDETYQAIEQAIAAHPERRCQLLKQTGVGKGDAVRLGFAHATGDVFMILDADLTVPPEDLVRFYRVLSSGKGEFVNGVRLVYPMEDQAMRSANVLGNKSFSLLFSWLLGQPIKDTLCGTKALRRADYELIAANRAYFGDFDPFGDFDLLFGAAKLNHKIVEMPIRYRARTYGTTNIQRWKHGWLLLRMVLFAAGRLKFV